MYYVTMYTSDPGQFNRVPEVYPRHRAYLDEFAQGGGIWLIGTFGDPLVEGSLAIFRTREAAEQFVREDPFVTEGVVASSSIREWNPLEFEPARTGRTLDPANYVG